MKPISQRASKLSISPIRAMTKLAERAGVINLAQGLGELPTFEPAVEGAIRAMREQKNRYSYAEGVSSLREVVLKKMAADYGLKDDSLDALIGVGSTGVFVDLCLSYFEPGDEVLLIEPYYGYHISALHVAGATPVFCATEPPRFRVTPEILNRSLTPRTQALILCNPSNPLGKVYSREELAAIAQWVEEKDLIVITDEIYEYIVFDGKKHICFATLPGMRHRTFTISGFSKTFSMTGWRLGSVVGPKEALKNLMLMNDALYICAPTPLQLGVAAAWDQFGKTERKNLIDEYQRKRDLLLHYLSQTILTPITPEGAYYILVDSSTLGCRTSDEAVMLILEKAKVATVAGSAFFNSKIKDRYVRFCFAKSDEDLHQAGQQLVEVFKN